jgi:hypothetical protein
MLFILVISYFALGFISNLLAEHETFFLLLRAISPIDLFALSFIIKSCIKQCTFSR